PAPLALESRAAGAAPLRVEYSARGGRSLRELAIEEGEHVLLPLVGVFAERIHVITARHDPELAVRVRAGRFQIASVMHEDGLVRVALDEEPRAFGVRAHNVGRTD